MKTEKIQLAGDVPGNSIELRVLRFEGKNEKAVRAYLQSSLAWFGIAGPGRIAFPHSDA